MLSSIRMPADVAKHGRFYFYHSIYLGLAALTCRQFAHRRSEQYRCLLKQRSKRRWDHIRGSTVSLCNGTVYQPQPSRSWLIIRVTLTLVFSDHTLLLLEQLNHHTCLIADGACRIRAKQH